MNFAEINWLAVIICVVVSLAVGFVWYSPKVFFNIWWKGIGKTEKDQPGMSGMGLTWTLTVLSSFIKAAAMAFMVPSLGSLMSGAPTPANGALTGFMIWLGFVAPALLVNKLFAGHGLKIWAIEAGNHLVDLLLFGLILGAWH